MIFAVDTSEILNGAGMDASSKASPAVSKLLKVWETRQAQKAARVGGLGLIAVSLAACGGSDTTPFAQSDIDAATSPLNAQITTLSASLLTVTAARDAALVAQAAAEDAQEEAEAAEAAALVAQAAAIAARDAALDDLDAAEAAQLQAEAARDAAVVAQGVAETARAAAVAAQATAEAAATAAQTSLAAFQAEVTAAGFASVTALVAAWDALANPPAVRVALTGDIDDVAGTANADTFDGSIGAGGSLSIADIITAGAGLDTLNIVDVVGGTAMFNTINISGIEIVNIRSVGDVGAAGAGTFDLTTLEADTVNVTQAADVFLVVDTATDVNVANAAVTGDITVDGGRNMTVTPTSGASVTLGASTPVSGAVEITHSDQGTGAIAVDGGTNVTIEVTDTNTSTGTISVGQGGALLDMPSGVVSVTQSITSNATVAANAGNIDVTGGTSIEITVNLSNVATSAGATDIIAGQYTATGGLNTTSITITQNNTAVDFDAVVTPATTESAVVTFGALAVGEAVVIGDAGAALTGGTDLTFTATDAMTAEEVASAFANLSAGATQGSGGPASKGYFSGALDAGWTSGAVAGATVTFTASAAGAIANDLDVATDADGTGVADDGAADDATFAISVTQGVNAVTTTAGQDVTATDGAVVVDGARVTTVTLEGFVNATLGGAASMDALTTLSLKDGAGTIALTSASTALELTLENIASGSTFNLGASIAALNLTTSGLASDVDFTAAAVTDVNIAAAADLDVSGGTFVVATDIDITGAGDVTLGDVSAAATDITAATATGAISATVGLATNVATGSGDDQITIGTGAISGTVNLGAGNDTLVLSTAGTTVTGAIAGGDGDQDVVSMTTADAVTLGGTGAFATAVTGFERLAISDGGAAQTIAVGTLGFDHVTLEASHVVLALTGMANAGTLVFEADQATTSVALAANTATDSVNLVLVGQDSGNGNPGAALAVGTVTANGIETINVVSTTDDADGSANATMTLVATSATTITVSGANGLTLTTHATSVAVDTIDASTMTGNLTYVATNASMTVIGGGGDDILTGEDLTMLTGGAGSDTFVMNVPTTASTYSTITDLSSGDVIDLTDGTSFASGAITLAATATFLDYADAVADAAVSNGDSGWFQFAGNTFIVTKDTAANAGFVDGADGLLAIEGLIDLSTASYNLTDGTLSIV